MLNDFSLTIGTVNGSGSQSANNILMRSIFRMGIPVEGKNVFPSNIAGLPTWFSIRVNEQGFTSRKKLSDIFVAMNPETFEADLLKIKPGGLFLYNTHRKIDPTQIPENIQGVGIDFGKMATEVSKAIQLKKLLVNMIYVGVLAELLGIPEESLQGAIQTQFKGKAAVVDVNKSAVLRGRKYAQEELSEIQIKCQLEARQLNDGKVLIDGNTAGGLGLVSAGCTFGAWYPITPSSSLAEAFETYCHQFRVDDHGQQKFAMVQAEDELSAISMVAGAGWAGARAMTTTSGPGISLMGECIGLMYFAEIPGVIWNVQRMGPSTGLPTRTSQGDLMACAYSSHGDCRHPVLIPSTPKECFEMAHTAFDIAEGFQTVVFVLSDLDLGMNLWASEKFESLSGEFSRGKVLDAGELEKLESYGRYEDRDGDGVPYRTLPGTPHDKAAYFTRGTGHTPKATYSEDNENYRDLLDRLETKWQTLSTKVPEPEIHLEVGATLGVLYYGSTAAVMPEVVALAQKENIKFNLCRVKAFPFTKDVAKFIEANEVTLVLEQNKFGQMAALLSQELPELAGKIKKVTQYDGLTLEAVETLQKLKEA